MGYYLPLFFTENEWFVCPTKEMGLFNIGDNHCEIGAEFKPYTYTVASTKAIPPHNLIFEDASERLLVVTARWRPGALAARPDRHGSCR